MRSTVQKTITTPKPTHDPTSHTDQTPSTTSLRIVKWVQIPDQQNAQQELGINRGSPVLTVTILELFPHELKTDVLVDQPQQMVFGNLIFQAEVVEQRLTPAVVSHHDQQASNHRNPAKHESF